MALHCSCWAPCACPAPSCRQGPSWSWPRSSSLPAAACCFPSCSGPPQGLHWACLTPSSCCWGHDPSPHPSSLGQHPHPWAQDEVASLAGHPSCWGVPSCCWASSCQARGLPWAPAPSGHQAPVCREGALPGWRGTHPSSGCWGWAAAGRHPGSSGNL